MERLEFYGAAPAYSELYYNLHAETAWCLDELDRRFDAERRSPIALIAVEPILAKKVLIGALKLRSALRNSTQTKAIWIDIFIGARLEDFWEALLGALVDLWFGLPSFNIGYFERRLLSSGAFPGQTTRGFHADVARILDQISGAEIIFVVDVRDDARGASVVLSEIAQSLDALLARQSNNRLAVAILGPDSLATARYLHALDTSFEPIVLDLNKASELLRSLDSTSLKDAGFSQMALRQPGDPDPATEDAAAAAKSLALVGEPVLKSAADYLFGLTPERTRGIDELVGHGSLERLQNGGVALTDQGCRRYTEARFPSTLEESRAVLEANSAHILSASRPTKLHPLAYSPGLLDKALSQHSSIVENISACLAARIGQSQILEGYLNDRLVQILRTRDIGWTLPESVLLDDALKYLSLVAFREPGLFNRELFKLTEEMTYALNAYGAATEAEGTRYKQAQRVTSLTYS